jgi:hypothetical protein
MLAKSHVWAANAFIDEFYPGCFQRPANGQVIDVDIALHSKKLKI